jgi:hypothetical protein
MLVYREETRDVAARDAIRALSRSVERMSGRDPHAALEALLRAGELECALADLGHPSQCEAQAITDCIAAGLEDGRGESAVPLSREIQGLPVPDRISLTKPEGYAYYALDPRRYAALAKSHPCTVARFAVVGIRSIGTSLGAMVLAALRSRGFVAHRTSVRPAGNPWERRLCLSPRERAFVDRARDAGAEFLVVDEGPGLSGSTFLAVGEALLGAGVPRERITFFMGREKAPETFRSARSRARWGGFRRRVVPGPSLPAGEDLSAGYWRSQVFSSSADYPACWTERERIKVLSADGRSLRKFEGYPPYDEGPLGRAATLAEAGFSPDVRRGEPGFFDLSWVNGRTLSGRDLDDGVVLRIADYAAFRFAHFPAPGSDVAALETMASVNVGEALGGAAPPGIRLDVRRPVYVDGRMMPHEWRRTPDGTLVKLDACDHGDDHLLPGPTDIAWDLASAVIEWGMQPGHTASLLRRFRDQSGESVERRLPSFLTAYVAFRIGELWTASLSADEAERARIEDAASAYRARLRTLVSAREPSARPCSRPKATRRHSPGA